MKADKIIDLGAHEDDSPKMEPKHRVLREVIRNFTVFESLCSQTGDFDIEYWPYTINFLDLQGCLKPLSKRKKEAIYLNVILDMKQKEAAAIMGITTVSVGQYVEQGLIQVAKVIWPDEE